MGTFVKRSNKIHVAMVLDESGSMGPQWNDTIGGANAYFEKLKGDKESDYEVTIIKFDTNYGFLAKGVPLSEIPEITHKNYSPSGGTALYDAVGNTLSIMEQKVVEGDKAIMVVITDGEENSSVEHTENSIKPWIERLQNRGNWTFVYLGAVEDAWANAGKMGISRGNVASYNKTATRHVFNSLSDATLGFATDLKGSTSSFYSTYVSDKTGIEEDSD